MSDPLNGAEELVEDVTVIGEPSAQELLGMLEQEEHGTTRNDQQRENNDEHLLEEQYYYHDAEFLNEGGHLQEDLEAPLNDHNADEELDNGDALPVVDEEPQDPLPRRRRNPPRQRMQIVGLDLVPHLGDAPGMMVIREPSAQVRSAWRCFLQETTTRELKLESLALTVTCVEYLMDQWTWLSVTRRPQKITLGHVVFVADDDEDEEEYDPHDDNPHHHLPRAAQLLATLLATHASSITSLELEDNINHNRMGTPLCRLLLSSFLDPTNASTSSGLERLRLRGFHLGDHALEQNRREQRNPVETRSHDDDDESTDDPTLTTTRLSTVVRNVLVQHCHSLTEVDLESCRFYPDRESENLADPSCEIDLQNVFAQGISQLTQLQSLSIYECGMTDARMQMIVQSLSKTTRLQQALLYDNAISPQSFITFGHLLQQQPQLERLKLAFWGRRVALGGPQDKKAEENPIHVFNQAVQHHTKLQKLDIFCKHVSSSQVVLWMKTFEQNGGSLQEFRFGVFSLRRTKVDCLDLANIHDDDVDSIHQSSTMSTTRANKKRDYIILEMKYGMLAGNDKEELITLFQGIQQLQAVDRLVLNQTHIHDLEVGQALQQALCGSNKTPNDHRGNRLSDVRLHSCRFHLETFMQFASFVKSGAINKSTANDVDIATSLSPLETLYLAGCRVDNAMIQYLVQNAMVPSTKNTPVSPQQQTSLSSLANLQKLDLSWNNMNWNSLPWLTLLVESSPKLEYLNLTHNEALFQVPQVLDDEQEQDRDDTAGNPDRLHPQISHHHASVDAFLNAVIRHPSLNDLNLSACALSTHTAVSLMREWEQKTLRNVVVSSAADGNGSGGIHLGFASVERKPPAKNKSQHDENSSDLVEVYCGVRASSPSLLHSMLGTISEMKRVQTVEFCGTDLRGPIPAKGLYKILSAQNCVLQELNINGIESPPINAQTVVQLAAGLQGHKTLQILRLAGCSLHDDMLNVLVNSLVTVASLRTLFLRYNLLTPRSLDTLAKLLAQPEGALENLDLASNEALFDCNDNPRVARSFFHALETHPSLHRLCLSHCGLQDNLVDCLFSSLEHNRTLRALDFGGNTVSISDNWISSLGHCRELVHLKIPRSLCADAGWDHLIHHLHRNMSIQTLRHDQGQMSLVHTTFEHEFDGHSLSEPRILSILERNYLLDLGLRRGLPALTHLSATTPPEKRGKKSNPNQREETRGTDRACSVVTNTQHSKGTDNRKSPKSQTEWLPLLLLLERLGSNQGDASPVYSVIRPMAAEVAFYYQKSP